jgi:tRNA nucleotidyltransferase (CCA-adding enzyme)
MSRIQYVLGLDDPAEHFESLRDTGGLSGPLPEIYALVGKTHKPEFHGEGDAFDHTMLALRRACELTVSQYIRFAVLVHDVGKGTTDIWRLPSHIGHEARGIPIVQRMCYRLNVPDDVAELALLVTEYHLKHHIVFDMRPTKVLSLLSRLGAYRKPERFNDFLTACKADHRGRIVNGVSHASSVYPQELYLRDCRRSVINIDESSIASLPRERFIQERHRLRLNAIKEIRKEYGIMFGY